MPRGRLLAKKHETMHFLAFFCHFLAKVVHGAMAFKSMSFSAIDHRGPTSEKLHFGHFGLRFRGENHRSRNFGGARRNALTSRGSEPPFS